MHSQLGFFFIRDRDPKYTEGKTKQKNTASLTQRNPSHLSLSLTLSLMQLLKVKVRPQAFTDLVIYCMQMSFN